MSKTDETVYLNDQNVRNDNSEEKTVYVNEKMLDADKTEYVGKSFVIAQKADDTETKTEYVGNNTNAYDHSAKVEIGAQDTNSDSMPREAKIIDSETTYYLPISSMLQGRYRIDSVLGEGGFGITYKGWDLTLNIPVAIKEYYPTGMVTRSATIGKTTQVTPVSQEKYGNLFRNGIDRVLDEARRLAKFRNTPGIVGVYDFFKANSTAYIVMEYIDGYTIDKYCKDNRIDSTTLFNMLVPVMDALQNLHDEGIIHRDISPDNIMVDKDGNVKLLDFGAARGFSEETSTTKSIILKKSYAPEEQYRSKGNQGPWTDVYALGATIYELITGQAPPPSIDRLVEDEIIDIKRTAPSLTDSQATAIMKALSVNAKDRWQSMLDFKSGVLIDQSNGVIKQYRRDDNRKVINSRAYTLLLILVLVIGCAITIFISYENKIERKTENNVSIAEKGQNENESDIVSASSEDNDDSLYKTESAKVNDGKKVNENVADSRGVGTYAINNNNGSMKDLSLKITDVNENDSTYTIFCSIENTSDNEITGLHLFFASRINNFMLKMKSTSKLSEYSIPANGMVQGSFCFDLADIQRSGIQEINDLFIYINDNHNDNFYVSTEMKFEDLKLPVSTNETIQKYLDDRINGTIIGNDEDIIEIDYIGYSLTNATITLCFDIENKSDEYYDLRVWFTSTVNKLNLKMQTTSGPKSDLYGHTHTLIYATYKIEELKTGGIDEINSITFNVAGENDKEKSSTAAFDNLNILLE